MNTGLRKKKKGCFAEKGDHRFVCGVKPRERERERD
jgi:hypothetical protein